MKLINQKANKSSIESFLLFNSKLTKGSKKTTIQITEKKTDGEDKTVNLDVESLLKVEVYSPHDVIEIGDELFLPRDTSDGTRKLKHKVVEIVENRDLRTTPEIAEKIKNKKRFYSLICEISF